MKHTTECIVEALRAGAWAAEIKLMDIAADRLVELQRLNDSMQVDRDLWVKVGREKLQAAEKERDQLYAEVERIKTELAQAISERTPHDYGLLAGQRNDYRERLGAACKHVFELEEKVKLLTTNLTAAVALVRPEPSRLEIAAMLKAGWFANRDADFNATDHGWWIEQADELIAAEKETK